ncbi:MAG TPA: hypothetical protein VMN60_03360 [Longimicrobiales bacterium]|nr:hypothetical protein [Longimicrobiales bacterium]
MRRMRGVLALVLVCGACSSEVAGPAEPELPGVGVYPLGTLEIAAVNRACPAGFSCQGVEVTCAGVTQSVAVTVAVAQPVGSARGVVVFTTGGGGQSWALEDSSRETELLAPLLADGFRVVQVRWEKNWLLSSPGNDAGTGRLGCRPATVIKWIYDTHFVPLGIARSATGQCGFCVTGNSGGSTQVSYTLSHYGLDTILDAVIPTGGPPHAAMAKACLRNPGEQAFWYPDDTRRFLDEGFGFFDGNGPCYLHDASYTARWQQESVATGGNDYVHPRTRVHFILGESDVGMRAPAGEYESRLRSAGSPWVTAERAPSTACWAVWRAARPCALHYWTRADVAPG